MNALNKPLAPLVLALSLVSISGAVSAAPRWTFDGDIHNNSLAVSPDERTAVVSYSERPELVVYDLQAHKVKGILKGYVTPRNVVFSPDGSAFYVSDSSLGVVRGIETATLSQVSELAAGPGAFGTTLSADGNALYVNNQAADTVSVFDVAQSHPVAVVKGFAQPRQGIRLSPDGQTAYVTNFKGDKITMLDTRSNTIRGEITGFNKLRAISVSKDGKTLYAANSGSNTIAVVDTAAAAIINTIPVGKDPYGAALTPNGRFVYSGNLGDSTLSVIDTQSGKVTATVSGLHEPRQAIVFSKDSRTAWVLNEDLSVSAVDLARNVVVDTLKPQ